MQDLGGNIGKNPFGENIPAKYKLIKEKQRTFNMDNGLRFGFLVSQITFNVFLKL